VAARFTDCAVPTHMLNFEPAKPQIFTSQGITTYYVNKVHISAYLNYRSDYGHSD